jgi:dTDP-4-dehydrorhamnose 3,5-epimerase/CDP-3, 6-dideoxy-D-glycero-D-glycero-4-hexulose-5-epimerase
MNILEEKLPGTFLLQPAVFNDERGEFVKTYHAESLAHLGIRLDMAESFFTVSRKHVIRGMHFQVPPAHHGKLVFCTRGRATDVLLDLRHGSGTYGKTVSAELSAENHWMFYIPPGVAHGFLALEDNTTIYYNTDSIHSPRHDAGIRWDSFGFDWVGITDPIVSPRDCSHAEFRDFVSPF